MKGTKPVCTFPIGYHPFHRKQLFNYQLNRWHSLGYARLEDMVKAGKQIRNFKTWKEVMLQLAEKALAENRDLNAAFAVRAAEFYAKSDDPDKEVLYNRFIRLFNSATQTEDLMRFEIPYDGNYLPLFRLSPAVGITERGVILLHGGFDSLIEEFYSMMTWLAHRGFDVIGFEGPGQGATLRKRGLPLNLEWEKPVKTIIDYLGLQNVTLVGLSMGGWLAMRAAAFEPRIMRVIASGHAIDYMKCMNPCLRSVHLWCMNHCRGFMDRMAKLKFENREGMAPWMVDHMKFITRQETPLKALEIYMDMNDTNICSERVFQDVLLLTGRNDHFIPFKMHEMQVRALVNARSVTERVFTRDEHAHNHCQIGNIGLALEVMTDWIIRA